MTKKVKEVKKGKNLQESLNNTKEVIKTSEKTSGNQELIPKDIKKAKEKKEECVLKIPSTGERVVYSKEVHGKDFREIAEETAKKYDGIVE